MNFKDKTIFITGATRGIGKAIGLKLAHLGANIVIASKSVAENPKLGGTIFSAAKEMEAAGGKALPIQCDIRYEEQIENAVNKAVSTFGGIDILINNASAISLTPTLQTESKRFDLMHDINVRGTFLVSKACMPQLAKSSHAHILTLSPPINMDIKWLYGHVAYTMSKYNMTLMTMAFAEEFKNIPIAANTLWPRTTIATAAVQNLLGGNALMQMSRKPEIMADAAFYILQQEPKNCSGNNFIDDHVLKTAGITDLDNYAVMPNQPLFPDMFLD
jgi:citronellol/citronellal dehydrogenase